MQLRLMFCCASAAMILITFGRFDKLRKLWFGGSRDEGGDRGHF